ncbi:uncharacterized protein LOC123867213 [Maniola jurtina]|uniref:uncharacterized protein LOC123867213 n=1 Tax=Maniola jurtina TaxID=191418 RepID=UPI001E688363|nr:uncharacterized protein LOC123867213 [Maniola jurtina]
MDREDPNNLSYEPMDVDLSAHSSSMMDFSYTEPDIDISIVKTEPPEVDNVFVSESSFDVNPETINKLVLSNIQHHRTSVARTNITKRKPMLLISLTVLAISILTHQIANFNCCESLNIEILRHNLTSKLYGQTGAVKSIIYALESKENRKMLLFYGGTGVGKTFAASLMLENILNHKNVYHHTMPSFLQTFSSDLMLGLLFCKSVILVVDDLTRDDMMNIKPLIKELMLKSKRLSKNITIILIYNCDIVNEEFLRKCDQSFYSELRRSLEDLDIEKYFIKFESLTQEHLRNCIEDELADRNISAKNIDIIVKKFNATLDGCKGVHQKLQYMKIL